MKKLLFVLMLTILITFQVFLQIKIDQRKAAEGLGSRFIFQPAEILNGIVVGGFRGLAADLLWIRLDEYSHSGQWYKLLPLFKIVTFLQPKFITAWSVGGWHMSFNMYHYAKSKKEKDEWLKAGLKFLKEGIMNNSDRYELFFEVGWTYFYKANDYGNAIKYLKRAVDFEHPQFVEHLLAHSYEKNNMPEESLRIWENIQKRENRNKELDSVVNREIKKLSERNTQ